MKLNFSTSSLVFLLFISINILSSCRDQNYDWNAAKKDQRVEQYEESFKSIFGDIDPQQSWDFSTCGNESVTRAVQTRGKNDVDFYNINVSSSPLAIATDVVFPPSVGISILQGLGGSNEGNTNNAQHGTDDYFIVGEETFVICPLFHGATKPYVFVVDVISDITQSNGEISSVVTRYIMNDQSICTAMNSNNYTYDGAGKKKWSWEEMEESNFANGNGGPHGWIVPCPGKSRIEMYLATVDANNNIIAKGSSIKGDDNWSAGVINKGAPYYNSLIMLDEPTDNDHDYNDLVVLTAGGKGNYTFPKIQEVTAEKRYMVEDLGTTGATDIDFNDIVVDFTNISEYVTTINSGTASTVVTNKTIVCLRAMGGTMDFQLCVNNSPIFQKSRGGYSDFTWNKRNSFGNINLKTMYNTGSSEDGCRPTIDWEESTGWLYKIEGSADKFDWKPTENNIKIVMSERSSGSVEETSDQNTNTSTYEIAFPAKGTVPSILAFDVEKNWRLERDAITFKESPNGGEYNWFTNSNTWPYPITKP